MIQWSDSFWSDFGKTNIYLTKAKKIFLNTHAPLFFYELSFAILGWDLISRVSVWLLSRSLPETGHMPALPLVQYLDLMMLWLYKCLRCVSQTQLTGIRKFHAMCPGEAQGKQCFVQAWGQWRVPWWGNSCMETADLEQGRGASQTHNERKNRVSDIHRLQKRKKREWNMISYWVTAMLLGFQKQSGFSYWTLTINFI